MKIALKILGLILIFSLAACNEQSTDNQKKEALATYVKTETSLPKEIKTSTASITAKPMTTPSSTFKATTVPLKNKIVSSTFIDYDKDNKKEEVQIILDEGNFDEDDELWAGQGPKWVGDFSIHVLKEGKDVFSALLNKLINKDSEDSIFFYSPEFQLHFFDYNKDQKLDFVLSQYFSSNGFEYYPFTIDSNGKIERLKIDGRDTFFMSAPGRENSVLLPYKENKIEISYYNNIEGSYNTDYYVWDLVKKLFVLERRVTGENN